jgi:hypothetical protein
VTSSGDLSSSSVVCRSAIIEGKLRGNLQCEETATINFSGKIPGRLSANYAVVERKAEVQCYRRMRVGSIDIKGRMFGEIIATGAVNIHKTGVLEGNVTAKSIPSTRAEFFQVNWLSGRLISPRRNCFRSRSRRPPAWKSRTFPRLPGNRCLRLSAALMRKLHPRSPYQKLGGYVHLPRLIDKAKLHRKGLLNGYNYKTVGFDKHLLASQTGPDAFEEAAHRLMTTTPSSIGRRTQRQAFAGSGGGVNHHGLTAP